MTKIIAFLIMGFWTVTHFSCAAADYIDSIISTDVINVYNNLSVLEQAVLDANSINIKRSVYFENSGLVNSDIFICDSCQVYVRNSGEINGTFHAGNGSTIIQTIRTSDDITHLDFGGSSFSVLVEGTDEIYLSDIMLIAAGADKITLHNASILLGNETFKQRLFRARSFMSVLNPAIELVGEITLRIDDLKEALTHPILSNVSGDGVIHIDAPNLDRLYKAETYTENNMVYLKISRETDYVKILDEKRGHFLNTIREIAPDNKTLVALDNVETMDELHDVIDRSVMLNPIKLMQPVKIFNRFEMNGFPRHVNSQSPQTEYGLETIFITGDGTTLKSGKASIALMYDNVNLLAGAYAGFFDHVGELNEFSGVMYGGNIQAHYEDRFVFINAQAGITLAKFETDFLFDGTGVSRNPTGRSLYGAADFGLIYKFGEHVSIKPYVGIIAESDRVLNQTDTSVLARGGVSLGYSSNANGIRSDYDVLINAEADGTMTVGAGMFFWSDADAAGGGVSYMMSNGDFGIAHKISANVRVAL